MKKVIAGLSAAGMLCALTACTPSRPDNCVELPGYRVAQILGDKATVKAWGAVRSRVPEADGSEVYYVAIRFFADEYDGDGVWLSYSTGSAESLDAGAEAWSGLPRSTDFDASDKQADEARRCVR